MKVYLSERGVQFSDHDVTADQSALKDLLYKYQSRSTPTVVIGDEVIVGFDPDRINQLLGL